MKLAAVGVHLEVAEPELLVDDVDERGDFRPLELRRLHFELRRQLQGLDVVTPAERQMMVFCLAREGEMHLVLARTVEQPFVLNCDLLHQIEGVALKHFGGLRGAHDVGAAFSLAPESTRRRRGPAAVLTRGQISKGTQEGAPGSERTLHI